MWTEEPLPTVHTYSDVTVGPYNGKEVVELHFVAPGTDNWIVVDRATAARLINQLRRALDDSYNEAISNRPGGSDDYGN